MRDPTAHCPPIGCASPSACRPAVPEGVLDVTPYVEPIQLEHVINPFSAAGHRHSVRTGILGTIGEGQGVDSKELNARNDNDKNELVGLREDPGKDRPLAYLLESAMDPLALGWSEVSPTQGDPSEDLINSLYQPFVHPALELQSTDTSSREFRGCANRTTDISRGECF